MIKAGDLVRCINGDNPVPGTTGWSIETGKDYVVESTSKTGDWLILRTGTNKGSYSALRFELVEKRK